MFKRTFVVRRTDPAPDGATHVIGWWHPGGDFVETAYTDDPSSAEAMRAEYQAREDAYELEVDALRAEINGRTQ